MCESFNHIVSGITGSIHLLASLVALVTGFIVLRGRKGDLTHKRIGYIYVVSMFVLIGTAFMLYTLFGSFGIFHCLAILSLLTLLAGFVPILRKRPKHFLHLHLSFMYWSVVGLYCAFVAELMVRLPVVIMDGQRPNSTFYNLIGVATGLSMFLAVWIWKKKKSNWMSIADNRTDSAEVK